MIIQGYRFCDFILVINTDFHPTPSTPHRFQVTADFFLAFGRGYLSLTHWFGFNFHSRPQNLTPKKLETSLDRKVQNLFRYLELCMRQGCGLGLDVSVSRRSREVYQRLVSVSSWEKMSTSRSHLGLGHLRLVPKTNFGQIVQATVRSVNGL